MTNVISLAVVRQSKQAVLHAATRDVSDNVRTLNWQLLLAGYSAERAALDLEFIKHHSDIIDAVSERAEEMHTYIFVLGAVSVTSRRIDRQRELIRSLDLQRLCREIMLSDRTKWLTESILNGALVLELMARFHQVAVYGTAGREHPHHRNGRRE